MLMSTEKPVEYRAVPGFSGYRVGSDGSVWSQYVYGSHPPRRGSDWFRLTPSTNGKTGHVKVSLYPPGTQITVHRLVLLTFVGPCPPGMEACHDPDELRPC